MALDEAKKLLARGLDTVGAHDAGAGLAASTSDDIRDAVSRLFVRGLRKLYAAHRQGSAQASENSEMATAAELKQQLKEGAQINLDQRDRLADVFRSVDLVPEESFDQAMQGIIDDNKAANAETRGALALDLLQIDSGQIAAHFYIARYGTLHSYAETLGHKEAARLLRQTIDETVRFDGLCTKLAHKLIVASA